MWPLLVGGVVHLSALLEVREKLAEHPPFILAHAILEFEEVVIVDACQELVSQETFATFCGLDALLALNVGRNCPFLVSSDAFASKIG